VKGGREVHVKFAGDAESAAGLNRARLYYSQLPEARDVLPSVIAYDDSRTIVPFDYMIMTSMPGRNFAGEFDSGKFDFEAMMQIYFRMGSALAMLHRRHYVFFGEIEDVVGQGVVVKGQTDWKAFLLGYFAKNIAGIGNTPFAAFGPRIMANAKKNMHLFEGEGIQPTLLHRDYQPWNILLSEGGEITGVLDPDLCMVGHSLFDFISGTPDIYSQAQKDQLVASLISGYFGAVPPTERQLAQIKFYRATDPVFRIISPWAFYSATAQLEQIQSVTEKTLPQLRELKLDNNEVVSADEVHPGSSVQEFVLEDATEQYASGRVFQIEQVLPFESMIRASYLNEPLSLSMQEYGIRAPRANLQKYDSRKYLVALP
jgi:hypothetical protein